MNTKKITFWIAVGVLALAQFWMMVEPTVTFAGSGAGHVGG